jgi:hypothetical protein
MVCGPFGGIAGEALLIGEERGKALFRLGPLELRTFLVGFRSGDAPAGGNKIIGGKSSGDCVRMMDCAAKRAGRIIPQRSAMTFQGLHLFSESQGRAAGFDELHGIVLPLLQIRAIGGRADQVGRSAIRFLHARSKVSRHCSKPGCVRRERLQGNPSVAGLVAVYLDLAQREPFAFHGQVAAGGLDRTLRRLQSAFERGEFVLERARGALQPFNFFLTVGERSLSLCG